MFLVTQKGSYTFVLVTFNYIFLAVQETEAVKKQYTKILDAYGCLGVLQLYSGESTLLYLVMVTGCFSIGKIADSEIFRITQTQFVPLHHPQNEDRIAEVCFIFFKTLKRTFSICSLS